jgi:hypothetical protein
MRLIALLLLTFAAAGSLAHIGLYGHLQSTPISALGNGVAHYQLLLRLFYVNATTGRPMKDIFATCRINSITLPPTDGSSTARFTVCQFAFLYPSHLLYRGYSKLMQILKCNRAQLSILLANLHQENKQSWEAQIEYSERYGSSRMHEARLSLNDLMQRRIRS